MKVDLVVSSYIFDKDKVLLIHHKKLDMWIGVGGHIEENENPDQAIRREIKEETNLDIGFVNNSNISQKGKVIKNLATPFYVNIHNVGDHNHACFFYICKVVDASKLKINNELKSAKWILVEELKEPIDISVINQVKEAYKILNE